MGVRGTLKRAVFLDRDGVLNRTFVREGVRRPPASLAQLEILPGVPEALNVLRAHGYSLIVVTNQPDVARGISSRGLVEAIHARLRDALLLDAVLTCLHDDADQCECRKPRPGLLLHAADAFDIELSLSLMVGDSWRDVEAGRRAGCRTFLVDPGREAAAACDFRVGSLAEAASIIIGLSHA
jgi:D-glycero-D-manno-heptose 1,7-bisphosphate phosphatase